MLTPGVYGLNQIILNHPMYKKISNKLPTPTPITQSSIPLLTKHPSASTTYSDPDPCMMQYIYNRWHLWGAQDSITNNPRLLIQRGQRGTGGRCLCLLAAEINASQALVSKSSPRVLTPCLWPSSISAETVCPISICLQELLTAYTVARTVHLLSSHIFGTIFTDCRQSFVLIEMQPRKKL